MSDEEDVVWGEQAQIAVNRELNPPKGPGGNPRVDRRSTTGSNFMRCLPDQATCPAQLTLSDRRGYLGGFAAVRHRQSRSKSGMHLCQAERQQHSGRAEVGLLVGSGGRADDPGGSQQDIMLMGHADGSEGSQQDSMQIAHGCESGKRPDGSRGSHVGRQPHDPSCVSDRYRGSDSSCSVHTISSFFSARSLGQKAAGQHPQHVSTRIPTGADSRLRHASLHSGGSHDPCSMSCGCSHDTSLGRSCTGSCCMHGHVRHNCLGSGRFDMMATMPAGFAQQQAQFWKRQCKASSRDSAGHSASVPSRLVQKQMYSRRVLSTNACCRPKGCANLCHVLSAQQRQTASRLKL